MAEEKERVGENRPNDFKTRLYYKRGIGESDFDIFRSCLIRWMRCWSISAGNVQWMSVLSSTKMLHPSRHLRTLQILSEMCSRLYEQDRQSQTYTPWDPKEGWNDPPPLRPLSYEEWQQNQAKEWEREQGMVSA
jgi:hypothetical protein